MAKVGVLPGTRLAGLALLRARPELAEGADRLAHQAKAPRRTKPETRMAQAATADRTAPVIRAML